MPRGGKRAGAGRPTGGFRHGSGRPLGTGFWGQDRTKPRRLPEWLWAQLQPLMAELKFTRDLYKTVLDNREKQ